MLRGVMGCRVIWCDVVGDGGMWRGGWGEMWCGVMLVHFVFVHEYSLLRLDWVSVNFSGFSIHVDILVMYNALWEYK